MSLNSWLAMLALASHASRSRRTVSIRTLRLESLEDRSLLSGTPLSAIPGTAGLWHLDEGGGAITADVGGPNPGTLANGAQWVAGNLGNALKFDGVDDYALLKNGPILGSAPNFTVEAWVKWDGGGTTHQHQFIYSEGDYNDIIDLYLDNGVPSFTTLGSNWYTASAAASLPTGEWHHLAGVLQAGVGGRLYVDGQLVATNTNMGPGSQYAGSTNIGRFAGNLPGGFRFFRGAIDEVRILNVARSAAEIQADYQQGLDSVTLTAIEVTPVNPTLNVGQSQQFTATGLFSDGSSHPLIADQGAWSTQASIPTVSYGLGAAVVDGTFYAISGFATSRVAAYNPQTNVWTDKAPLPAGLLQYFGTAVIDGKIYVVGGDTGGGGDRSALYVYDPATNAWTQKASMPLGSRYALAAGAINGKLYAVGGYNIASNTYLSRLEEYDPATNTWQTKASMPTARVLDGVAVVDGRLYVAGGSNASGAVTALEIYDPSTNSWSFGASQPTAQTSGVGVIDGKIYMAGGGPSPETLLQVYDPVTNNWTTGAPMTIGRHGMGVAADPVNRKLFAVGGWNGSYVSTLEVFVPSEVTWSSSAPAVAQVNAAGLASGLTAGSATITATMAGVSGSTLLTVVSPNQPPVANAFGPYTDNEGGSLTLDGSHSSDPDQSSQSLTYLWDLDGDDVFGETGADASRGDETGVSPTFSATGLDGPSTWQVSLQVTDNGGLSSTDLALIEITNWEPLANLTEGEPVSLGSPATVTFENANDLSPADVSAGFHYAFALDADSLSTATYENSGSEASATFSFDDGLFTHTVYGRILDKDGGYSDYSTELDAWQLTPPSPTAGVPTGLIEVFRFAADEPVESIAGTIEWGDGEVTHVSAAEGNLTENEDGTFSVWGDHTYSQAATGLSFSVGGDGDEVRFCATIDVAAPVNTDPNANDDLATATGASVTIDVLANDTDDDGNALTVTGIVQGANGTAVINANGTVTYTVQYYFAASQTFSYTVSDGQGGTATATVTVQVSADAGLSSLATQVAALGLNAGNANSLLAKLNAAQKSLASGQPSAALGQLNAFENSLAALVRSGRLSATAANLLTQQVQALRASIG